MRRISYLATLLAFGLIMNACKRPGHSNTPAAALIASQLTLVDKNNAATSNPSTSMVDTSMKLAGPGTASLPAGTTSTTVEASTGAGQLLIGGSNQLGLVDPSTLVLSTLVIEDHTVSQPVASSDEASPGMVHEILIRIALVSGADYYKYYICSVSDPGNCNPSPSAPMGFTSDTYVVQNMPKGQIRVVVSACINPQHSSNPSNCGPEKTVLFTQTNF